VRNEDELAIEEQWLRLDPIFIMGRQRTGTSIMWRTLQVAGFHGFPEGHLWLDLIEPFAHFRNPEYKRYIRHDLYTLGSGRNRLLEKRFAIMIDRFHRDLLPPDLVRWVNKSPGRPPIDVAPMLAELFPRSQFIFMMRNPIMTVHSTIARSPHAFRGACEHWVTVMRTWRSVRPWLVGRYIEVAQEQIAEHPDLTASQVAEFLRVPQFGHEFAHWFKTRRENTSFPDKEAGDFVYPVDWTKEQRATLAAICQEEMAIWGYPLDFERPGGPDPAQALDVQPEPADLASYYRWLARQGSRRKAALERELAQQREREAILERELTQQRELVDRILQGRVMRALNKVDRMLRRLGLR